MGQFAGGIITFVIIIIAIVQALSPIFQAITKANEKSKQGAGNGGRIPGGMNSSVPPDSAFLPEFNQQGIPRPAAMVSRPQPNQRAQNASGGQRGQQSRQKQRQPTSNKNASQKGSASANTKGNRSSGSGVGAHVDSYIGQHVKSHIGKQIGDGVQHDISDQVRNHLGDDKNKQAAPSSTTHGSATAGDLLTALRSPQGVRQAILISEVLGKPKALRRS